MPPCRRPSSAIDRFVVLGAWVSPVVLAALAGPVVAMLVLLPLGLVIASAGSPWTVWANIAARPALTFDARSAWITNGRVFGERTILTFQEAHRVIAAAPATWRVIERDPPAIVVREWQLGAGGGLTWRPGGRLVVG